MNGKIFGIGAGVFAVLCLMLGFGTYYTIDQTQRGVLLRNGAIVIVEAPGLHFKAPWIDSVEKIDVTSKLARWEKLSGYSHDQQEAHYQISVNYQPKVDKVAEIYGTYGGLKAAFDTQIAPKVLKLSKVVIGQFTAQSSIQDRANLNNKIFAELDKSGVSLFDITGVNVEDIEFGREYTASINQRMIAEVAVQTANQTLEKEKVEAKIRVTKAQAAADSNKAEGDVVNGLIKGKGDAEAYAIEAKAKALGQNPGLVTLIQAERWNGALPSTMLPGAAMPMLSLKP